jgi:hypothetical protein
MIEYALNVVVGRHDVVIRLLLMMLMLLPGHGDRTWYHK